METRSVLFEELVIDVVAAFGLDQLQFVRAARAQPGHRDFDSDSRMRPCAHAEVVVRSEKSLEGAEMRYPQHPPEPSLSRVHVAHDVRDLAKIRRQQIRMNIHRATSSLFLS